jgi:hypothetical protein
MLEVFSIGQNYFSLLWLLVMGIKSQPDRNQQVERILNSLNPFAILLNVLFIVV